MKKIALLLAVMGMSATAPAFAKEPAATAARAAETVTLPASNGRTIDLSIWQAATPKGLVIFGHGMGSRPQAYQALIDAMVKRGYTVLAPLAVDSMAHPDRAKFDLQRGFGARVEDLMVTRGYAFKRFAGMKVALAGHSYGSLMSLIGGGAITPAGDLKGPPVAALVLFSSPGVIPGLATADSYRKISVPMLMVTGDKDLVPGFVRDARDHRVAFDSALPGDKLLVTVSGGTHDMLGHPDQADAKAATDIALDFLDANLAADAKARGRIAALSSTKLYTIERR